jgi:hypothetical protein
MALLLGTAVAVIRSRQALILENLALRHQIGVLRRVLRECVRYDNGSRTHLGLAKDCPETRPVEPPHLGVIRAAPMVGGLHHPYFRNVAGPADLRGSMGHLGSGGFLRGPPEPDAGVPTTFTAIVR